MSPWQNDPNREETDTALHGSHAYTSLAAGDLARAKRFYTETLGLELVQEMGDSVAILSTGSGSPIFIYEREPSRAEHTVLGFVVDDFDRARANLMAAGVRFEVYKGLTDENGVATHGDTRMAWFTDTEGNIITLNTGM